MAETRGNTILNLQEENASLKEEIVTLKEEIVTIKEENEVLRALADTVKVKTILFEYASSKYIILIVSVLFIIGFLGNDR